MGITTRKGGLKGTVIGITQPPPEDGVWSAISLHRYLSQTTKQSAPRISFERGCVIPITMPYSQRVLKICFIARALKNLSNFR